MSDFSISAFQIPGLKLIERHPKIDNRGRLERLFCARELAEVGWTLPIAQINRTVTLRQGTVRGLHYQRQPFAEMKLVCCLHGAIWDVALDLRRDSPTFLRWQAVELSAENNRALMIPQGCAHGFQSLTENVELLYCHSTYYEPAAEAGVNPLDGRVAVNWPLPVSMQSTRDAALPTLDEIMQQGQL